MIIRRIIKKYKEDDDTTRQHTRRDDGGNSGSDTGIARSRDCMRGHPDRSRRLKLQLSSPDAMAGVYDVHDHVALQYFPGSPLSNPYHHLTAKSGPKPFVVGLVQARMGSTRLPGKVLLPLPKEGGMPVLWHDFNRLKACKNVDKWVLATSTWHTDTVLEEFAKEHGILCFRGSEGDCMERIFTGAIAHGAKPGDYILRITSDCPLIDAGLVDRGVEECINGKYDQYGLYDQYPRSTQYADGLDFQVFSYNGMARMNKEATEPQDREHVGPYMMDNPEHFRVGHMDFPVAKARNRNWTLDNPADYDFLAEVYKRLWKGKDAKEPFSIHDLILLLEQEPQLSDINHTPFEQQNEGLLKSYKKKLLGQGINMDAIFVKKFDVSNKMLQGSTMRNSKSFLPVVASKQNCSVIDVDGNQFIDVSLCDGMVSFGHAYMFKAGLEADIFGSSALSYKSQGFSDEVTTTLKKNEYSKMVLDLLAPCRNLKAVTYASSVANAFRYILSSLGVSGSSSVILVDRNSMGANMFSTFLPNDAVIENFDSEVDNDLEEKTLKFKGRICGVVYTINSKSDKCINRCRQASQLAASNSLPFIIDEIRTSGRVAFPSIASNENIECDFLILGSALANGRAFYPVAHGTVKSDVDRSDDFSLSVSDPSVMLTFKIALLALGYYQNRCVIFNLNRFIQSLRSGINSALINHKMTDRVSIKEVAGRVTFNLVSNSDEEREKFDTIMHNELLGRGIYLKGNTVASSFSMCNNILVRFALAFESALGAYSAQTSQ